jgi:hypothetical protein
VFLVVFVLQIESKSGTPFKTSALTPMCVVWPTGVVKQTPRYPPPHPPPAPPQRTSSQAPQNEKIRKYSEEINNKKAEEEFLRSSLRGSKKLQQLEHNKTKELEPVVNNAFEADDDDDPQLDAEDDNKGI